MYSSDNNVTIRLLKDYIKLSLSEYYPETEIKSFIRIFAETFGSFTPAKLAISQDRIVSKETLRQINEALEDLKQFKPIQYILKSAHFYGLEFIVNENVLIPRPETEELVQWVLSDYNKRVLPMFPKILDIGTGSGCIAIALKKNLPSCKMYALDISDSILSVAIKNSLKHNTEIKFIKKDILNEPLSLKYDVIVSNPPYVTESDKKYMHKNVLAYEPSIALFVPDSSPLIFYENIAIKGKGCICPNGCIYLEINEKFRKETKDIFLNHGYSEVECRQDIFGKDRFIKAKL